MATRSGRAFCYIVALLLTGTIGTVAMADWPTFRGDAARSGYTVAGVEGELTLAWRWDSRQPPAPAWSGRDTRMPLDQAFHAVVADALVFFGSSADCQVHALDIRNGRERWTFMTDGPIRLAPTVVDGRLFVVSDDGYLYCLTADTGQLLWKKRGGPATDMLLGNDRMISRHPARGGPVVADGIVYFAAGLWPSEGIFVHAVDIASGESIWCNETAGSLEMAQPHPTAEAKSGISAQGNLVIAGDTLLVPTGRAVPAAFDRHTGEFRYFHLQANGRLGGAEVLADGDIFLNSGAVFDVTTGSKQSVRMSLPPNVTAATPDGFITHAAGKLLAMRRENGVIQEPWAEVEVDFGGSSLAVAGDTVISAGQGADGFGLSFVSRTTGRKIGSVPVDGEPLGLAVSEGRLLVSTDRGSILCYGDSAVTTQASPAVEPSADENTPEEELHDLYAMAAEIITDSTGVTEGYCLDFGCGDGGLAVQLALQTDLIVYAVDSDPENVAAARRRAKAAGIYGTRMTVHQADLSSLPYPDYFANLIVCGNTIFELQPNDANAANRVAEALRCLRPFGGVLCWGPPSVMGEYTRGPLDKTGTWTHQYCDPANSNCSTDQVVTGPLGMLWFNDLNYQMPSRHGRGNAPLFLDGRLFIEGLDAVRAVDAYNGRTLWEYALPGIQATYDGEHIVGVSGMSGNYCVTSDRLYIRTGKKCLALDPATGELLNELPTPTGADGQPGTWGAIACVGDTLFGSVVNTDHTVHWAFREADMSEHFTESSTLFAMDRLTGELKWKYEAEDSVRHNTIAIGAGRVYLIDRPVAAIDRNDVKAAARRGEPLKTAPHALGKLVALDAETGGTLWSVDKAVDGTTLAMSETHDVVVMAYQDTRFKISSERGGRMAAYRASDGTPLWDIEAAYQSRLILNDRTIYAQPGAWDLLTGKPTDFAFGRSYGCGTLAGSTNMLLFRSATLGYTDLQQECGTENYGGIRPGCWINTLPVGGLVLMPDATDRCSCSYLIKATIALKPYGVRPPTIVPTGGVFREPVSVTISGDTEKTVIAYTLDGTTPTTDSPRYTEPILVDDKAVLSARAYRPGMPPSMVSRATFTIDPTIIPLDGPDWQTFDAPGNVKKSSDWKISGDAITELSNYFLGTAGEMSPTVERPGTLRIYSPGESWTDGELQLEVSSADDDGLGVAFRCQGTDRYYLWAMDAQRKFHILACKEGDSYRVLDQRAVGYERNRWYRVRIVLDGANMTVYVDDEKTLTATDSTRTKGTFALYSWGSTGSKFRAIRWKP